MKYSKPETVVISDIKSLCVGTPYHFNGWVTDYKNCGSKFKCGCQKHGEWIATVHRFLWSGKRCKKCAGEEASIRLRTSKEEREFQITELCKNTPYHFVKWKDSYKNSNSIVVCYCGTHDLQWELRLRHFIYSGTRCPKCAGFGYQKTDDASLYALRSECGQYVKIGITNNMERRLKELAKSTPFSFSLVESISENGKTIYEFETMFHREFKSANLEGFKGATEWLKWSPDIQHWLRLLSS